ncbi:hypothetical protein DVS77_04220 [Mycolicibacterium moriokaense]|nr:hypothetical protein DVS77_04220 [Mycolicibacterium moriokaense]
MLVRRGLLALTLATICAIAFELATVRHWNDLDQAVPWAALFLLTVATLFSLRGAGWTRIVARVLALVVFGAAIYGVIDHTIANYESGPLDQRFAESWESLSATQQWWYAFTKHVGPSPTLAPGALSLGAALLLLATLIDPRNVLMRKESNE